MPRSDGVLHEALLRRLEPITRWRHPAPGDGQPAQLNPNGVDVWENHVGDVRVAPDGTIHPYFFVQTGPGSYIQPRLVAASTYTVWRPVITVAAGTPAKARWALDKLRTRLDGAVLLDEDGRELTAPMHEGFARRETYDPGPLQADTDASPPRWFVPIQYATTAH